MQSNALKKQEAAHFTPSPVPREAVRQRAESAVVTALAPDARHAPDMADFAARYGFHAFV